MSYTRSYSEVVSGSTTVRISYPSSESGGTVSETVTIDIPVNIQIHVDTSPFDEGIDSFKGHLNVLTGSVVATEAAQVAMVAHNATDISNHITSGFFGLIRSELTQQMAEYKSRSEALFLKLNDMKDACLFKISQMERDYARISERYTNLFNDLDNEIKNRINNLDSASFSIQEQVSKQSSRVFNGTLSTVATVFSGENSQAQSKILASELRQRANQLLQNTHRFLLSDKRLSQAFRSMFTESQNTDSKFFYTPTLYLLVDDPDGKGHDEIFTPSHKESALTNNSLLAGLRDAFRQPGIAWETMSSQDRTQIETYLNTKIAKLSSDGSPHQVRVCENVVRLWKGCRPQVLQ